MDKIKNIYVMGDGATWIRKLTAHFKVNSQTNITFNLDKFSPCSFNFNAKSKMFCIVNCVFIIFPPLHLIQILVRYRSNQYIIRFY